MKVTAILPPFLPVDDIRKTAASILPDMVIRTDTEFESDDSEVLVATTFTRIDANVLKKFPSLKFLQIASTGYDNVDLETVRKRGIVMCNSPTSNKESVAEHVIGMTLSSLRISGSWTVKSGVETGPS